MTPAEQLYDIAKTLPDETIRALLNLVLSLDPSQPSSPPLPPRTPLRQLPPGTLTGLRGVAKGLSPTEVIPQDDYASYLAQKYQ